jgi:hypothetical protein
MMAPLRSSSVLGCSVLTALAVAASAGPAAHRPSPKPPKPAAPLARIVALQIEPPDISLTGPRAEAHFVVTADRADGTREDVTTASAVSTNVKVARLTADRALLPTSDGDAKLTATLAGKAARAIVHVKDANAEKPIEFAREIVPILTRAGCNQGACHGSQYGKGGFKVSLSGFDPDVDYFAIVKQSGGRRALPTDPYKSLVLRKPSLKVAHQGGLRLPPDSPDYRRMAEWIRQGAPGPTPKDPVVIRIDVYPSQRVFTPGSKLPQRLVVVATYSDGVTRDVTSWTRFGTLNDAVASVTPEGAVKAVGRGETSIMVRFGGQATVARMSVPFARIAAYPTVRTANYVDELVMKKWRTLGLIPSEPCDDATFMRRLYFDLIGTPPTMEEVKAFLADTSPDKRAKLIDRVLDRPEYADYWTLKWGDLLRSNRNTLSPKGMWSLTNWIRGELRDNRPMDQFAHDLITAQGSTFTNGPANYYRVASNPQDLAETTAQVFLGMRLQCVKCHHHPFEKWSQQDYYQFAAYFARVGQKGSQEFGIFGNEQVVRINKGGEVYHPKSGQKMVPTPLGGYPERMRVHDTKTAALIDPDPDSGGDRRAVLADWITQDNPLFARNIVNRYWGYLMGRGLVEPIDDQRITNPPTNPELLDALAKDLVDHKYDVKHILRTICNSRAYQLSSEPTVANLPDTSFYTHYTVKRLPAESLFDAVNIATGTQEKFNDLPLGTRAIQLPDPNVSSYFLDTFGRAPRIIACECERAPEPNMSQALHLMMGEMLNRKVQDGNALPAKLLAEKKSDPEILQAFYYTALGRPPRPDEAYKAEGLLKSVVDRPGFVPAKPWYWLQPHKFDRVPDAKARDRKQTLEDIYWALLNSKEFIFNH